MNATISRLLVFFIGIPAIAALCLFVPAYNSVAISSLIILFSGLGGMEASAFLTEGRGRKAAAIGFIMGLIPPLGAYLAGLGLLPGDGVALVISLAILIVLGREAFSSAQRIPSILSTFLSRLLPLLYPGLLAVFMVKIGAFPNPAPKLLLFFVLTFGNDSMAWLFGVLLGRRRNIVPVSPNKSWAGFVGGMAFSVIAAAVAPLLFPAAFPGPAWSWLLLGLLTGTGVIVGDLSESALKRSAGEKDSGSIIPGRGGVLDSIDSLLYAAPLFWACLRFFPGLIG